MINYSLLQKLNISAISAFYFAVNEENDMQQGHPRYKQIKQSAIRECGMKAHILAMIIEKSLRDIGM